jgi:hypothetical protein
MRGHRVDWLPHECGGTGVFGVGPLYHLSCHVSPDVSLTSGMSVVFVLSVCLSCLFCLCIPPVVYGRSILCLLYLRVAMFSGGGKGDFIFF